MKKIIAEMIYTCLVIAVPFAFAKSGYGLNTWQWWAVAGSILIANIAGYAEGSSGDETVD